MTFALIFLTVLALMVASYGVGYVNGRSDEEREQLRERLLERLEGR